MGHRGWEELGKSMAPSREPWVVGSAVSRNVPPAPYLLPEHSLCLRTRFLRKQHCTSCLREGVLGTSWLGGTDGFLDVKSWCNGDLKVNWTLDTNTGSHLGASAQE